MSKVAMIGIDAMDSILLEKFKKDMPNFSRMISRAHRVKMCSIFPPDSQPAWATIYTGLSPAQHGIINFVNPLDRTSKARLFRIEDRYIKGKTFWDMAGKFGKKSCLVLPFNIFPGWEINGTMVCRINRAAPRDYPLTFHPGSKKERYTVLNEDINLIDGMFSKRWLRKVIDICKKRTEAEAELGLKMFQNEEWALFYNIFTGLDTIQHYFWTFYDEKHPDYPGENPYQDVIKEFYILMDEVIGRFLSLVDGDTTFIILSDHGLGLRPTKVVNINEVLREKSYLVAKSSLAKNLNPFYNTRWIKRSIVRLVNILGLGPSQIRLLRKFPIWKRLLASPLKIDWEKTVAYVTDLSSIKSYSYGGIRINRDIYKGDCNELIERIIRDLNEIKDPDTSENLVKYIGRREELYRGEYIDKYPEILLELKHGYGLGWEVNGPLIETGDMHNIYPGSHMMDTPIFIINGPEVNKKHPRNEISLMDIAPTVLDLLDIRAQFNLDGTSLFGK